MSLLTTYLLGSKDSLRKHSSFYLLANILSKGFLLISMPFLTRMLTPSDFGIITIFDSIYHVMTVLFSFAVEESIKRYYFEEKNNFNDAAGSMYTVASLFSILFLFFILLLRIPLSNSLNVPTIVIVYAALLSFLALPKGILLHLLNAKQKSKTYSLVAASASLINLFFTLLFVYFLKENKYEGRLYGQLVPAILLFMAAQIYCLKRFKLGLDIHFIKYFLKYSLPLIPYRLSGLLLTYVDSMIIGKMTGMTDTGLYSIAYRIGMGVLLLHTSISMALEPKIMVLMNYINDNVKKINNYIENSAKALFFFGFAISVFAKYIMIVLVPSSYMDALNLVPIIILSYCILFIYEQFTRINRFYKKTYINTTAMLISVSINIVLNILLIPEFGYKVAAFTTLISMIVLLAILWYNTRIKLKVKSVVNIKRLVLFTLLPISVLYVLTTLVTVENIVLDLLIKIIITSLLILILFKDKIKNITIK